ncbi:MAG: ABC-F family ATP-binding cassette domain-containing protein, partial [Albidovulum sp.]
PDFSGYATALDYVSEGLAPDMLYRAESELGAWGVPFDLDLTKASGGQARRIALAHAFAHDPDIILLDEPTNHLDIEATLWLEARLRETRAAFVMISHDRAFLRALTRTTLWIDRGVVRRNERGFEAFEDWRETVWAEEDLARHKLDRRIRAEARWAVEGISARRRRNQGRVRALQAMRAERAAMIRRKGAAAMALETGQVSGRLVIEAKGISKTYGARQILRPFDLTILRGDRVAFVGPNGAGKTTLLKILTGEIVPDTGAVRHGTNLEIAVFDQARATLDPAMTLWDGLVQDPQMRVSGRSDQVMVRGQPRHVVAYLKDFLFDEAQARAPVGSLSGGERARLLLARIMARESNLLVLDEPTNDLDVETLDLLQDLLGDYEGTVLLVSHDRDFIDRVATTTVAFAGDGRVTVYAGGWTDYQAQRPGATFEALAKPAPKPPTPASAPVSRPKKATQGLTFTEKHRLDALPGIIERLEAEIGKLSDFLSDPDLFRTAPDKFRRASEGLAQRQAALAAAEEEWLMLEEKASA